VRYKPAENAENKVEHEERADDDQTDKVDPRPAITDRVIDLKTKICVEMTVTIRKALKLIEKDTNMQSRKTMNMMNISLVNTRIFSI